MAVYFAMRIEAGKLNYNSVMSKYSKYKDEIDEILIADGYVINDNGTVSKTETAE